MKRLEFLLLTTMLLVTAVIFSLKAGILGDNPNANPNIDIIVPSSSSEPPRGFEAMNNETIWASHKDQKVSVQFNGLLGDVQIYVIPKSLIGGGGKGKSLDSGITLKLWETEVYAQPLKYVSENTTNWPAGEYRIYFVRSTDEAYGDFDLVK